MRCVIMIRRICSFVIGLFIMSVGVAFSIYSTLGTTPISSISYALALITNINIGITTFVFNAALILMQLLILHSGFKKRGCFSSSTVCFLDISPIWHFTWFHSFRLTIQSHYICSIWS